MSRIFVFVLSLLPCVALCEPFVIHDSGAGVSTAPYKRLFNTDDIRDIRDSWIFGDLPEQDVQKPADPVKVYPITTTKLTPKILVQDQEGYFPRMLFPICLVGDDKLSLAWVERHRKHLAQSGAQCFVVSARSAESVAPLMQRLSGIPTYPANGDAIADYFGVKHYPILITDRYASQ